MAVRVLVVDDSRFFRRRVAEMLETDPLIKVIGTAENGAEAVQKSSRLKPDVITMDIEMPVMDGITATKRILTTQKIPILMFSSLTTEGAQATLDALDAGAVDYLPKRFEDISKNKEVAVKLLCERVKSVVRLGAATTKLAFSRLGTAQASHSASVRSGKESQVSSPIARTGVDHKASGVAAVKRGQYKLIVIGTSTGGPVALQSILSKLPKEFYCPILLVQHMPGSFTTAFAQRLDKLCRIAVKEAQDGDELQPGVALLAPGGRQMEMQRKGVKFIVKISPATSQQNYKPSVDITFRSVAAASPGKVLAIVLTGMGSDGCDGARVLKQGGASIWAQDESSSIVYGMPAAIVEAGLADNVLTLNDIGNYLAQRI